jgi:hypothetical protein
MFQHIHVKNFRCFAGLHLARLGRVNLITGKNNSGKTALLEAIQLHNNPTDWQLPITINKIRGIDDPAKALEDVCGWLFYHKHVEGGLEVGSSDEKGMSRTLTVWILDASVSATRFPEADRALRMSTNPTFGLVNAQRLILRYEQANEPERISIGVAAAIGQGTSATWVGARVPWSLPSVYLSSAVASPAQDVKFFGELESAKRQEEILPSLQILEPRLRKLSLVPLAGETIIHGDIGLPRLVPVPFMGEGMRRLLSILLAIANARGGVLLVDEIENGMHYSVQKQVWQAIAHAARENDVQVFATTHSYECINAAHEAFAASEPYDFTMQRLDRSGEEIEVVRYDRDTMEYALEMSHEVR